MTLTGTVSDFDEEGLFGLISADNGSLLVFNLLRTMPALRGRFTIGTRVEFIEQASSATMRAIDLVPIDVAGSHGHIGVNA